MKKLIGIFVIVFILFFGEMFYINYRLNREISQIQKEHIIISNEIGKMGMAVAFSKIKLNKLRKKIGRPLYKKTDYIFASNY